MTDQLYAKQEFTEDTAETRESDPRPTVFDKCRKYTRAREAMAAGVYPYFHRIDSAQEPDVVCDGQPMIMMSSNDYLGLTNHPKVKEAAIDAIRKFGTGCAGSRFLNGTLAMHEEMEEKLARFLGKEAAAVFPTGFQANLGAISALVGKSEYVIIDRMNHASIYDGCRLSYGQIKKYQHNDMENLERILKSVEGRGALVVVDGVFKSVGKHLQAPSGTEIIDGSGKWITPGFIDVHSHILDGG